MLNLLKSSREKKDCAARVTREAHFDRNFEFRKAVNFFILLSRLQFFLKVFFRGLNGKLAENIKLGSEDHNKETRRTFKN